MLLTTLTRALLIFGIGTIVYAGVLLAASHVIQRYASLEFDRSLALPLNSRNNLAATGSPIGKLTIPSVGISAIVLEGADSGTLNVAPGHIPGTAFPRDSGNVGIAGHRDTFFRNLEHIQAGDSITLTTREGDYEYKVDSMEVVDPTSVEVLAPSTDSILTLVTGYPFHIIGPTPMRYIVRGRLINKVPANSESNQFLANTIY